MKSKYSIVLILLCITSFFAQTQLQINEQIRLINPIATPTGVIAVSENESSVYLITDKPEVIVSGPGSGRYLELNKTGKLIGLKFINQNNGLQTPAVYDIETKTLKPLWNECELAGQVSFSDNGKVVFSVGTKVIVADNTQTSQFDIGVYSNRTPVSPDGNQIVYKDNNDQLWIYEFVNASVSKITDDKQGYCNADWSPDGKYILYTTTGSKIYSYEISSGNTFFISDGEKASWSPDSKKIIFQKKEIDFENAVILNSDIYSTDAKGNTVTRITNTKNELELEPTFGLSGENIIYINGNSGEIRERYINPKLSKSDKNDNLLFNYSGLTGNPSYMIKDTPHNTNGLSLLPNWVHIHQVFDTRDSGEWLSRSEGTKCCGATAAAQLLASYGILKPNSFTTYNHISNFGLYISDPYTYNGITYNNFSYWYAGGHGFMWSGGSPYSNTIQYLRNHGITDTRREENVTWGTVTNEVDNNFPIIICTTSLTSAHIVLVTGKYGTSNTVVANDPYGDKNAGNYGKVNNGEKALYDWADANTGRYKITPVAWAITARFTPDSIPEVYSVSPSGEKDSCNITSQIKVTFSNIMDRTSVESAFSITPYTKGSVIWDDSDLSFVFKPDSLLKAATKYTVTINSSAKNIWGKNLFTDYTSVFVTKNREKLKITKIYPANNQNDISTTVKFRIVFDGNVTLNAMVGNVLLYNYENQRVMTSNVKLNNTDGKTTLSFETSGPLENGKQYRLVLNGKITDTDNIPMKDTITVNFTTEPKVIISTSLIDNMEQQGEWKNPSYMGYSYGIDTLLTNFRIAAEKKTSYNTSGKITYSFTGSSDGLCRVLNAVQPIVNPSGGNIFGIWIYGDYSGNILEYWFTDSNKEMIKQRVDTIKWTGWKFKSISTTQFSNKELRFNSLIIKQDSLAQKSGEIYFDDLQQSSVTGIQDDIVNSLPGNYSLSQNYPNPFNPSTRIDYSLPVNSFVTLKVFDILGREIATLVNEQKTAGNHSSFFTLSSSFASSGTYFYQIKAVNQSGVGFVETKKMIYIK